MRPETTQCLGTIVKNVFVVSEFIKHQYSLCYYFPLDVSYTHTNVWYIIPMHVVCFLFVFFIWSSFTGNKSFETYNRLM